LLKIRDELIPSRESQEQERESQEQEESEEDSDIGRRIVRIPSTRSSAVASQA
jgi:hypothetical protein